MSVKKLPTVEQVESIIEQWGRFSVQDFARRFDLEEEVVEETVEYIRRLKRAADRKSIPAMVCFRNDRLESIVRCAGARHGFV